MATNHQESSVLIGVPSSYYREPLYELNNWKYNYLGWMPTFTPETDEQLLQSLDLGCTSCGSTKVPRFIGQIYSPLCVSSTLDRILHFYKCVSCPEFIVTRTDSIRPKAEVEKVDAKKNTTPSLTTWNDDADDWGDDEDNRKEECATSEVALNHVPSQLKMIKGQALNQFLDIEGYPMRFLDVELEQDLLPQDGETMDYTETLTEDDLKDGTIGGIDEDIDDDGTIEAGDRYDANVYPEGFEHEEFERRIREIPNQVLRYHLNGRPLRNCARDQKERADKEGGVCPMCGSIRRFECQLMPGLIAHLEGDPGPSVKKVNPHHHDHRPEIEFATILVFTCPQNCTSLPPVCSPLPPVPVHHSVASSTSSSGSPTVLNQKSSPSSSVVREHVIRLQDKDDHLIHQMLLQKELQQCSMSGGQRKKGRGRRKGEGE